MIFKRPNVVESISLYTRFNDLTDGWIERRWSQTHSLILALA